jgi:hypothetical protein
VGGEADLTVPVWSHNVSAGALRKRHPHERRESFYFLMENETALPGDGIEPSFSALRRSVFWRLDLVDQALDVVVLDKVVPGTGAQIAKSFDRRDRWLQTQAAEAIVVWDGRRNGVEKQLRSFERVFGDDVWRLEP